MMADPPALELIRLAPDPIGEPETALRHAAQLAELLNGDEQLPPGIRRKEERPPETAEGVLSAARKWCLERNASFYGIVLDGRLVIGSISLSYVDPRKRTGRTGYFLGSRFQNQGYGTLALAGLLVLARDQGLEAVSGTVPESEPASRRIWEKSGFPLRILGNEVTGVLG